MSKESENGTRYQVGDITFWTLNSKFHRIDGPALIVDNGLHSWFVNGKSLNFEEWFEWVMTYSSIDNQMNVLLKVNELSNLG